MTERRGDHETREMINRASEAAAAKIWDRIDEVIERAATKGAELALQKFGELMPVDMATKDGRDELRSIVAHAKFMKDGCESIKSDGMTMARRGALTLIGLSVLFGGAWMIGINPDKVFKIFGGPRP